MIWIVPGEKHNMIYIIWLAEVNYNYDLLEKGSWKPRRRLNVIPMAQPFRLQRDYYWSREMKLALPLPSVHKGNGINKKGLCICFTIIIYLFWLIKTSNDMLWFPLPSLACILLLHQSLPNWKAQIQVFVIL